MPTNKPLGHPSSPFPSNYRRFPISDIFFGQKQAECRNDRIDIRFGFLGQTIDCQVVFDSGDYAFAPDLVFDSHNVICADPSLLPKEWRVEDEACLHSWLSHVRQKLFAIGTECEEDQVMQSDDDLLLDSQPMEIIEENSTSAQSIQPHNTINTHDHEVSTPPILPSTAKATRRDLIEYWVKELADHVIRVDADHFRSLSALTGSGIKVSKPREMAPALVQLNLPDNLAAPIHVALISAVNNSSSGTNEVDYMPDRLDLEITGIDPIWSLREIDAYIKYEKSGFTLNWHLHHLRVPGKP
ncbi:hypothetical protein BX666DRAFT_1008694 [Dichotomocladium elegans]|nr:hypothetical protein BX666DRAFT_1008694 [Dichotomocladium elegans]